MQKTKSLVVISVCLIAAVVVFLVYFGKEILHGSNITWLMAGGDWTTNYLGWAFFRNEPWSFPPGIIRNYFAPMGTSISLTDSLPLLGFLFKPFSPFLPSDFQYFGMWILLCYVLQGTFGLFLIKTVTPNHFLQFLGSMFFLLSPVLLHRMHFALMGQWLILASLWLYFVDDKVFPNSKKLAGWFLIILLSTLVQPYLSAMVFMLFLGFITKRKFIDNRISFLWFITLVPGVLAVATLGLLLSGAITSIDSKDYGVWYQYHSMNLNSLINPHGTSYFMKSLPLYKDILPNRASGQGEGFCYLGFGMLLLTYYAGGCLLSKTTLLGRLKNHTPLLIVLLIFAGYSLSNTITLGDHYIISYEIPSFLKIFTNSFRTSGRFIWPVYYLAIYFVIAVVIMTQSTKTAAIMLLSALLIQAVDVYPLRMFRPKSLHLRKDAEHTVLRSPLWKEYFERFDRIVMCPPFRRNYNNTDDFRHFAYLAAHYAKPITVGYVARTNHDLVAKNKRLLEDELRSDNIDKDTLYIMSKKYFEVTGYRELIVTECQIENIDGYYILFSKKNRFELPDAKKPSTAECTRNPTPKSTEPNGQMRFRENGAAVKGD